MNVVIVLRTGFAAAPPRFSWDGLMLDYPLGSPFSGVWPKIRASGAEYALLLDDIIEFRAHDLRMLHRLVATSPSLDGATLHASALASVYGMDPPRASRIPWTASHIAGLPSWFALLRVAHWPEQCTTETPEFFLLQQRHGKGACVRIDAPTLGFDPTAWAGALVSRSAALLASDYTAAARTAEGRIPLQFQVFIPGSLAPAQALPAGEAWRPSFSVICPSIRPDFLREAVESVRAQSWPHWELRIGIDGPKEVQFRKIAAVLDEYKADPRIHIRRFPHQGTGPIRRRLAIASRGDFIMTLDDDDRLLPHTLERFAQSIGARPDVVLVRGGTRLFGIYDSYLPPRPRYRVGPISNDLFEVNQPFAVRRDVLEAFGGFEWDPGLKNAGEDSDLFLKVDYAAQPVVTLEEPLYERRLSTLNQTLDCTSEECARHIHFLYGKHDHQGWALNDVQFQDRGAIVGMTTVHRNDATPQAIVCSTGFMNYQQVGSRDGVVLDLEITSLCNAACDFCPRNSLERHARFIPLETVQRIADTLRKEREEQMVVLAGIGESTLHPELLQVIRSLADASARVCLTTNGWNLTVEFVDALTSAGLRELNVSLNASTSDTHAAIMRLRNFEAIDAACRQIAAVRLERWPALEFHVSFVVTDRNECEADEFVQRWNINGVSQIWLHRLTNRRGLLSPDCRAGNIELVARKYSGDPKVVVDLFPERDGPVNLCRVVKDIDFISVDGEMLLCAQDYQSRHRFGRIGSSELGRLREVKLLSHLRGETAETCSGCTFCPPSFKNGYNGRYSIVQAGALNDAE
jgi:MoaA/NifB/PqqE/SkfB family radical SAM enzyme